MSPRWEAISDFLIDIERLKLVERSAWVSDLSRHENSAEHSWHLALGLLVVAAELHLELAVNHHNTTVRVATTPMPFFDPERKKA